VPHCTAALSLQARQAAQLGLAKKCQASNITGLLPSPSTSGSDAVGRSGILMGGHTLAITVVTFRPRHRLLPQRPDPALFSCCLLPIHYHLRPTYCLSTIAFPLLPKKGNTK
jgi:hypothetical protein